MLRRAVARAGGSRVLLWESGGGAVSSAAGGRDGTAGGHAAARAATKHAEQVRVTCARSWRPLCGMLPSRTKPTTTIVLPLYPCCRDYCCYCSDYHS